MPQQNQTPIWEMSRSPNQRNRERMKTETRIETQDVIDKYRVVTIRHAANAIFNKLNEALCFAGTDQGKLAGMEAQALANAIVASPNSESPIAPPRTTPPREREE